MECHVEKFSIDGAKLWNAKEWNRAKGKRNIFCVGKEQTNMRKKSEATQKWQ